MATPLQTVLDAVGHAACDKGRKAFTGLQTFGDVLPDVAKSTLDYLRKHAVSDDIRLGLGELAAAKPDAYRAALTKTLDGLARVQSVPFRADLAEYLAYLPLTARQVFRRPSDPTGRTPPEKLDFYKPEQLLVFLPPRRPRFRPGDRPPGLDNYTLDELRGLGECSEVWVGHDPDHPERPPVALKFAADKETAERLQASTALFQQVFELNDVNGVVPLEQVFLETDPPCLESQFVSGYDLTGLMAEWRWRFDTPKPDAALKLMRRICDIVGQAQAKGVVHRDLKPSNVLIHPTEGGKFTLWVTDFGWGQIEAPRSLELAKGGTPKGEQARLAYRGAYTPLYASPQQARREPPDPRDDVHALGVIWYQLLKRDPHAAAPVGEDWADDLYRHGFTSSQMKLLCACVATRPEKRPGTAGELARLLHAETCTVPVATQGVSEDGSRVIKLTAQDQAAVQKAVVTRRGKPITPDGAAQAAAASLGTDSHYGVGLANKLRGGTPDPMAMAAGVAGIGLSSAGTRGGKPALIRNSLGMVFAYVPPGTFDMGAADDEPAARPDERPRHPVRISKGFYLSVHQVTQGCYERLLGQNPAFFTKGHAGGADLPVDSVVFADAERFCRKLEAVREEQVNGRRYRLPTEAEWEYACRAGTTTAYSCGAKLTERDAHHKEKIGPGQGKTDPVGQHPPNPWGLYDMHGNVGEWCTDWYDEYFYFDCPGADPKGPPVGTLKVVRGGSWADPAADCRSAARKGQHPTRPCNTVGFRVLMATD